MKKNNYITSILLVIAMYLMHVMFDVALILMRSRTEIDKVLLTFLIIGLVFGLIALIFGCINGIFAIYNVFRKTSSPSKITMILKLVLIPWYIQNIFVWLIIVAGFCNPFLMLGIPIIIFIGMSITYVYMICTSVQNLSYAAKLIKNKKIVITSWLVLSIIFHFIFVLDVVGSILFHFILKKNNLLYNA